MPLFPESGGHFRPEGPSVDVLDMADARERRAAIQAQLLKKHPVPLISFTLNIMGPVKVFPLSVRTFYEGVRLIELQLSAFRLPVLEKQVHEAPTGDEAFFSVDAPLKKVKEVLLRLEEHLSAGRLFDMDVIGPRGEKISRTDLGFPGRKCLLCGKDAFVCARSRSHTVEELLDRSALLMQTYFEEKTASELSSLSMQALLCEVSITPKPGLVDRHNNGAHRDMDIFTFEASAVSLNRWFSRFALCGMRNAGKPYGEIFASLRSLGIEAEDDMFRATGGVNTHKGLIFALSVLNCAIGIVCGREEPLTEDRLSETCRLLSAEVEEDFRSAKKEAALHPDALTHGEKSWIENGLRGARGEALSGYRTVFEKALPVLRHWRSCGCSINDSGVLTLLHIIAETEDTNLVSRSSFEEAAELRHRISETLKTGQKEDPAEEAARLMAFAEDLDREFIARNLSPGGSADLLALTLFLHLLEQREEEPRLLPAEHT